MSDVTCLLTDRSLTWTRRRTLLQGWRGEDAACAGAATALVGAVAPICVPSILFTAVWGVERATGRHLIGSRSSDSPVPLPHR